MIQGEDVLTSTRRRNEWKMEVADLLGCAPPNVLVVSSSTRYGTDLIKFGVKIMSNFWQKVDVLVASRTFTR